MDAARPMASRPETYGVRPVSEPVKLLSPARSAVVA